MTGTYGVGSLVGIVGTVPTSAAPPPGNFYTLNVPDQAGVVAANNFLSFYNPAASGKTITIYHGTIIPFASGADASAVSMKVFRISGTAPSGGTPITAANIQKFATASPNSIADIRTGNPTVGTVASQPIFSAPPAIGGAGGTAPDIVSEIPNGASFTLMPGEGIVASTSAGLTAQVWSFGLTWNEN